MRVLKAQLYGTRPSLQDRAGTFACLLYKDEKPPICPVCLHFPSPRS